MKSFEFNVSEFNFESKIKFYYSLLYCSATDTNKLKKYFGNDLNIFENKTLILPATEYYPLQSNFQKIKKIYDQITLSDEEILRLLHYGEIVKYFKEFLKNNKNDFDFNNKDDIERFYRYLVLSKVENHISYGTLRNFFRTCSDIEIDSAIKTLDFRTKREFCKLFGDKGEEKTTFKVSHDSKNSILIRLYNHILLNRKNMDIISTIKTLKKESEEAYKKVTLEDLKKDNKINEEKKPKKEKKSEKAQETLEEFLKKNDIKREDFDKAYNKLNRNQKKLLRYYFGLENEKRLTIKEMSIKENNSYTAIYHSIRGAEKRIIKLIKTGKINEEKKSKKEKKNKKTKETLEEFLKKNNIEREDFDKAYNKLNRNQKKLLRYYFGLENEKRLTIKEISIKENNSYTAIYHSIRGAKKRIIKLIKTGKINEEKKPKKEKKNKKTQETLEKFLKKNDIEREDFDKVLKLLSDFQRECLELYFGLNDDGIIITYEEIAKKLNKTVGNVSNAIYNGKKRIITLIKTGEINEEKKTKKRRKIKKAHQTLEEFLKQNDIKREDFDKALKLLGNFQRECLELYFELSDDGIIMTYDGIAKKLNKTVSNVSNAICNGKKRIIMLIKTEEINEEKKSKKRRKIKKAHQTLEEFLKQNDIKREDFDKALKLLGNFQRECLELYFGLSDDGIIMTYDEIAKKLRKRRSNVVTTVYNAKKNVVELIKTERNINEEFKKINDKLNYVYKKLLSDDDFRKLVSITSPVGATALSLINNFNFTLDELSVALFMDKDSVIKLLLAVSIFAVSYIENPIHDESIDYGDSDLLDKTQVNAKKKGNSHNG